MWGKLRGAVRASPKSPKTSKAPPAAPVAQAAARQRARPAIPPRAPRPRAPAPAVAPAAAPAVDHRARLVAFYEKHNPAKLDSIDATLEKYAGRETELFEALRAQYEAPAVEEKK